jgi:HAMP domain-containing protein
MGLRSKFNLVLLAAFVVGLVFASILSYVLAQDYARQAVLQEARVMMAAGNAMGNFTDTELAPLLTEQLKTRFLPQSIPFWVEQTNFRGLTKQFPDYTFHEPALNPTNLADRPAEWERVIIDSFRSNPTLSESISERETPTGAVLSLSRPIVVGPGCLTCHSTPAAAPASMVELYGPANGFGWKPNEIVGATIVSVPMAVAQQQAFRTFAVLLGGLILVFILVLVLMNLLLHFTVLRPVIQLASIADRVSIGEQNVPDYTPKGRDEIASLAASFNRMRRSVENAMRLLEP